MPEPYGLTVSEAARQILGRQLSPVDLMESLLGRIDSLEPQLKAWVYLDHDAVLAEAKQKQAELDSGARLGPLHGVPIGVKDIYYTAGIPTTACSRLYADFVPEYDCTTVALLKRAGAIMLGKTVTTEFACADPSPTINPWNAAHTPGGSSSGSAVAVAARMCSAALGSQTVGSVLRPASYNGVVGFKPSFGRVSRYGIIPVSWSLDHPGWMARTVEDVALLMQVMAGPDPQEAITLRHQVDDYMSGLTWPSAPRIGVVRRFFYDHADEETRQHTDGVLELLSKAGAIVEDVALPDSIDTAIQDQQVIMAVEAAAFHQAMYEERSEEYQPLLRAMLQRGLDTDVVTYSQVQERRQQFIADMANMAGKADILLTPSTPTPALADLTTTGNTMYQGPWTSCGLPTVTIPSGLSASGLPFGIQLGAGPGEDASLLAAAKWCETVLNVDLMPPLG